MLSSGRFRPPSLPAKIRRILFIRTDRIGDMVLSTPAIRALKTLYPEAELTVAASPSNHVLLRHDPDVDHILVFEPQVIRNTQGAIRRLRALRRLNFDVVVDPMASHDLATALVAFTTNAPLRVGFGNAGREVFFTRLVPRPDSDRHMVDLTLDMVRHMGADVTDRTPSVVLTEEELEFARQWMQGFNPGRQRIIGVHPGAYYSSQRWPIENYIALVSELQRTEGCRVVLLGGPSDEPYIEAIRCATKEPLRVFGNGNLRRAAALMSQLHLMVCNNSGPLHLAAAMQVPTVSFMGPTNAQRWWPVGPMHRVLRIKDLPCLGCEEGVCPKGNLECLRRINVHMAVEAVKGLLNDRNH